MLSLSWKTIRLPQTVCQYQGCNQIVKIGEVQRSNNLALKSPSSSGQYTLIENNEVSFYTGNHSMAE